MIVYKNSILVCLHPCSYVGNCYLAQTNDYGLQDSGDKLIDFLSLLNLVPYYIVGLSSGFIPSYIIYGVPVVVPEGIVG
jgi:hypothetical protein